MSRSLRKKIIHRVHRIMMRAGLLGHPYGRDYVRDHYSWTGRPINTTTKSDATDADTDGERT